MRPLGFRWTLDRLVFFWTNELSINNLTWVRCEELRKERDALMFVHSYVEELEEKVNRYERALKEIRKGGHYQRRWMRRIRE